MTSNYFRKLLSRISAGRSIFDVLEEFEREKIYQKIELKEFLGQFLLRPSSEAKKHGLPVKDGEPWSLTKKELIRWLDIRSIDLKPTSPSEKDFPPWMIKEWKKDFGVGTTRFLIQTLGSGAPLALRASLKTTPEKLARELRAAATIPIEIRYSRLSPFGLLIGGYQHALGFMAHTRLHDMGHFFLFSEGRFEMQDEASQIVALFSLFPNEYGPLLGSQPSPAKFKKRKIARSFRQLTILDACAGTGGKIIAIADILRGRGNFFATDISKPRLNLLKKRAKRAQLPKIKTLSDKSLHSLIEKADLVLVDAPCSGLGVLRRTPYLKWQLEPTKLSSFSKTQLKLLKCHAQYVKPGGRLVYSVCTFRKAETLDVVSDFVANHPEFKKIHSGFLGPDPCDGFFMASFERLRSGNSFSRAPSADLGQNQKLKGSSKTLSSK